jgi:ADP-ribosylglycohydrolase
MTTAGAAPLAERIAGCLLGQCLGDALGFPVEGEPPARAAAYVEAVFRRRAQGEAVRPGYAFGQYTDDSQLARELALSLVAQGGFDPQDYGRRLIALFAAPHPEGAHPGPQRRGGIVGRGVATAEAVARLAQGVPWPAVATPSPAAGNGAAMRAAPIGLFFAHPGARQAAAADQARLTHADPRAIAAACVFAEAVALALASGTAPGAAPLSVPASAVPALSASAFAAALGDAAALDPPLAQALPRLPGWIALSPAAALAEIGAVGEIPEYSRHWRGISGFASHSVLFVLYCFLRHPDDYWEAIATAIGVGGDVDTSAAMTGALVGARLGLAALPPGLVGAVHDAGAWGHGPLLGLAAALHAGRLVQGR